MKPTMKWNHTNLTLTKLLSSFIMFLKIKRWSAYNRYFSRSKYQMLRMHSLCFIHLIKIESDGFKDKVKEKENTLLQKTPKQK
jgi:hypothetical protein